MDEAAEEAEEQAQEFDAGLIRERSITELGIASADRSEALDQLAEGGPAVKADERVGELPADVATTGSVNPENYGQPLSADELEATDLINIPVLAADDEIIGNTEDVIVSTQGHIDAVLVDVGGFLGIGERRIAIALENAEVRQGSEGGYAIITRLTSDTLENAPSFDAEAYRANRDAVLTDPEGSSQ